MLLRFRDTASCLKIFKPCSHRFPSIYLFALTLYVIRPPFSYKAPLRHCKRCMTWSFKVTASPKCLNIGSFTVFKSFLCIRDNEWNDTTRHAFKLYLNCVLPRAAAAFLLIWLHSVQTCNVLKVKWKCCSAHPRKTTVVTCTSTKGLICFYSTKGRLSRQRPTNKYYFYCQ